ncbi:MAG: helix-turn-helix domain-containing protein [Faecalibacterium prausnitzii]
MAYFSCGRNMTRTSNALFIHKTTLFYRFERMEKLVGPFLQQSKRLFLYEYSLHLLHEITPCPGV